MHAHFKMSVFLLGYFGKASLICLQTNKPYLVGKNWLMDIKAS